MDDNAVLSALDPGQAAAALEVELESSKIDAINDPPVAQSAFEHLPVAHSPIAVENGR